MCLHPLERAIKRVIPERMFPVVQPSSRDASAEMFVMPSYSGLAGYRWPELDWQVWLTCMDRSLRCQWLAQLCASAGALLSRPRLLA